MIPEAVAKRWGKCWPAKYRRGAPWWSSDPPHDPYDGNATIRRCDGRTFTAPHGSGIAFAAAMVRIDREHPLPAPPPMPGQVYFFPDKSGIVAQGTMKLVGDNFGALDFLEEGGIPPGAILVYGPTPWGANCPWMDTREKP